MPRIGCMREAEEALLHHVGEVVSKNMTLVGHSSRYAYLAKSGVVYKVPRYSSEYQSENEYANIKRCQRTKVPGWKLPHANLFKIERGGDVWPIVAMEYIKHDGASGIYGGAMLPPHDRDKIERAWGIRDLHSGNVHQRGGINYIIDCGIT